MFSAGDGAPCGDYGECDTFEPDLWNNESLQKGFSTYINYCYGCHSLKYSRWNRIATDLDIPEDLMFKYLIFDSEVKSGDLMTGSMIKFNAEDGVARDRGEREALVERQLREEPQGGDEERRADGRPGARAALGAVETHPRRPRVVAAVAAVAGARTRAPE